MNTHALHMFSFDEITKYLGYSAEEESTLTSQPIYELIDERNIYTRLPFDEAKRLLDIKKCMHTAMTVNKAAEYYQLSPQIILTLLKKKIIPGFKRARHGSWRVWVCPKNKCFLKWNNYLG